MADAFDEYFSSLPLDRQFRLTPLPPERTKDFENYKQQTGFRSTPDYNLVGAFLDQQEPTNNHLGSFNSAGQLLKNPTHPTAHKTALIELLRQRNIDTTDIVPPDTRQEGLSLLNTLISNQNKPRL